MSFVIKLLLEMNTAAVVTQRDFILLKRITISYYFINDHFPTSYRKQSIDLHCKSVDWFLYDKIHWLLIG